MKKILKKNSEYGLEHKRATSECIENAKSLKTPDELFDNLSDDSSSISSQEEEVEDIIIHYYIFKNLKDSNCPSELSKVFGTAGRLTDYMTICL